MNRYESKHNLNHEIYQQNNYENHQQLHHHHQQLQQEEYEYEQQHEHHHQQEEQQEDQQWIEYNSFIDENGSISALTFHESTELLWIGNQTGRVTSYLHTNESEIIKYSSFTGHYNPVVQLLPLPDHIISISSDQIKMHTLGGLSVATLKPNIVDYNGETKEFTCGTLFEPSGGLFRAGAQNYLFLGSSGNLSYAYDINIPNEPLLTFDVTSASNYVQSSVTYLTVGCSDGKIRLLDPSLRSNAVEHTLDAHSGGVSNFTLQTDGMTLISTGYQSRPINLYQHNSPKL